MPKLAEMLTYRLELIDRLKHSGLYTRKDEDMLGHIKRRLLKSETMIDKLLELTEKLNGGD